MVVYNYATAQKQPMQFFYLGKDNSKTCQRISDMLEKRGHKVVCINHQITNFHTAFMEQRDYILASDGVIADATELETPTGYMLTHALESGKPCLLVYFAKETLPAEISDLEHRNLTTTQYEDRLELEDVVDNFAHKVSATLDAKLFMIIPPEVNKYLEWVATHTVRSKSDVVRSSVMESAKKDKDYQEFLKQFEK